MSNEPQSSNIKSKAPKTRIYTEEAKEEGPISIDNSPAKSKIILPPIKNKQIKKEEALEERSFEKIKVPPLASIKNLSIKNVDSKKFNPLVENKINTAFPQMFHKS
jgi:hypothetical protein